ncbi:MAG: LuxR C-terminal-related transcriptional regulator [Planctomycetota bacterium]
MIIHPPKAESQRGHPVLSDRETHALAKGLLDSDPERGVVLLTLDRRVLYSNTAASNFLRDGTERGRDALLPAPLDRWLGEFAERIRAPRGPTLADAYYPHEEDRRLRVSAEAFDADRSTYIVLRVQSARPWNEPTVRRLQGRFALTLREAQVASHVARGHSNGEVADRLGIVEKTVKNVLMSVYKKCGVRNRVELALRAYDAPVGSPDLGNT